MPIAWPSIVGREERRRKPHPQKKRFLNLNIHMIGLINNISRQAPRMPDGSLADRDELHLGAA